MGRTHIFWNPIEVLLHALIELIEGANETEFVWHDEPGEYRYLGSTEPCSTVKIQFIEPADT